MDDRLWPAPLVADFAAAVHPVADVVGFYAAAQSRPWLWLRDSYVDLGLLTLAGAEATIVDGRLITKREALAGMCH